jgi:tetratricopeptide (TPR) repeat protein
MVLLLGLLIILSASDMAAQGMRVKTSGAALHAGCDPETSLVATLDAGVPLRLRYVMMGETPCYKVAAEVGGKEMEGYLPQDAIEGLDTFEKSRREAAWISTATALNAVREPLSGLKAPAGTITPVPASARVILARAEQLIEESQPAKALAMLEPELQKRHDPMLLAMAGVAAWRGDDAKQALAYWKESLDLSPNPRLEQLYRQVEKEQSSDQSNHKLYGSKVVLRYDPEIVPVDTARAMVGVVDGTFTRVSSQLGCSAEEKIVTIIQSREAYQKATNAAEWNGGQYDGRIRVPVMSGQQMNAAAEQVLAHETTHACLAMLGEWPSWLHEGMAQKLSGEVLAPEMRVRLTKMAQAGKLPKLEEMRQQWSQMDAAHAGLAYALALAAVDALYQNYGSDGVRTLMRNPDRLPSVSAALDKSLGL